MKRPLEGNQWTFAKTILKGRGRKREDLWGRINTCWSVCEINTRVALTRGDGVGRRNRKSPVFAGGLVSPSHAVALVYIYITLQIKTLC